MYKRQTDNYPKCPQETTSDDLLNSMENYFEKSRNNLGLIYVLPAGDNGNIGGDTGFTFMQQSRFGIIVGATTNRGTRAYYSNRGCSLFVNAPSGGFHWKLDDNFNIPYLSSAKGRTSSCNNKVAGTSASAAIVSGALALILSKRPDLSWRDIQYITALTSVRNDPFCPVSYTHLTLPTN